MDDVHKGKFVRAKTQNVQYLMKNGNGNRYSFIKTKVDDHRPKTLGYEKPIKANVYLVHKLGRRNFT